MTGRCGRCRRLLRNCDCPGSTSRKQRAGLQSYNAHQRLLRTVKRFVRPLGMPLWQSAMVERGQRA